MLVAELPVDAFGNTQCGAVSGHIGNRLVKHRVVDVIRKAGWEQTGMWYGFPHGRYHLLQKQGLELKGHLPESLVSFAMTGVQRREHTCV